MRKFINLNSVFGFYLVSVLCAEIRGFIVQLNVCEKTVKQLNLVPFLLCEQSLQRPVDRNVQLEVDLTLACLLANITTCAHLHIHANYFHFKGHLLRNTAQGGEP